MQLIRENILLIYSDSFHMFFTFMQKMRNKMISIPQTPLQTVPTLTAEMNLSSYPLYYEGEPYLYTRSRLLAAYLLTEDDFLTTKKQSKDHNQIPCPQSPKQKNCQTAQENIIHDATSKLKDELIAGKSSGLDGTGGRWVELFPHQYFRMTEKEYFQMIYDIAAKVEEAIDLKLRRLDEKEGLKFLYRIRENMER